MAKRYPWFSVRWKGGRAEAAGDPSYKHGHVIDRGAGRLKDGIWSEWSWDGSKLTIRNDRYGFDPLYYWHDPASPDTAFAVSPNIIQLIAEGFTSDLDYRALGAFMRTGVMWGDDTPWTKFKALPPNATVTWEGGKLTVTGGPTVPKANPLGREKAIDAYIDLFRAAIARRPSTANTIVPISGGRDSRHIYGELWHQKMPIRQAFTWGPYKSFPWDEVQTAARLSQKFGVPHTVVKPAPGDTFQQYEVLKNTVTSLCADDHFFFIRINRYFRENGFDCTYDGNTGDIISSGTFSTRERHQAILDRRWDDLISSIFKQWSPGEETLRWLWGEDLYKKMSREAAVERITRAMLPVVDSPMPYAMTTVWNRTRRKIAVSPYAVYADIPLVYSPYLDHDLFDMLCSQPAEYYYDKKFHDETIAKSYPIIAGEAYSSPPSKATPYNLTPAAKAKIVADMLAYAREHNPGRVGTVVGWAARAIAGRPIGKTPRKYINYWVQLEAMRGAEAARTHLDMLD